MSRDEYMTQLERELRHLPEKERHEALLYYSEFFDDAGPDHESEVIEGLGSPKDTAAQILKDVAIKRIDEPAKAAKRGISTIWIVILALCAAPIGLPILIAVFAVGLAFAIVAFAIVCSLGITGVALCAAAVLSIGASFYFMPIHVIDGITVFGAGLFCMGIGLLLLLVTGLLSWLIFRGMAGSVRRLLSRGKRA